jgi:hypothetical protein
MQMPRTVGRLPRQRFAPALPIERRLCSSLPTSPMTRDSRRDLADLARAQPHLRVDSFAREKLDAAAGRARDLRALAGIISTQWIVVPTGMLRTGRQLPGLIAASGARHELRADVTPRGAMM